MNMCVPKWGSFAVLVLVAVNAQTRVHPDNIVWHYDFTQQPGGSAVSYANPSSSDNHQPALALSTQMGIAAWTGSGVRLNCDVPGQNVCNEISLTSQATSRMKSPVNMSTATDRSWTFEMWFSGSIISAESSDLVYGHNADNGGVPIVMFGSEGDNTQASMCSPTMPFSIVQNGTGIKFALRLQDGSIDCGGSVFSKSCVTQAGPTVPLSCTNTMLSFNRDATAWKASKANTSLYFAVRSAPCGDPNRESSCGAGNFIIATSDEITGHYGQWDPMVGGDPNIDKSSSSTNFYDALGVPPSEWGGGLSFGNQHAVGKDGYKGSIYMVAFYNRSLTDAEITTNARAGPPLPAPVALNATINCTGATRTLFLMPVITPHDLWHNTTVSVNAVPTTGTLEHCNMYATPMVCSVLAPGNVSTHFMTPAWFVYTWPSPGVFGSSLDSISFTAVLHRVGGDSSTTRNRTGDSPGTITFNVLDDGSTKFPTLSPTAAPTPFPTSFPTPAPSVPSHFGAVHRITFGASSGFVDDFGETWAHDACSAPLNMSICSSSQTGISTATASTGTIISSSGNYSTLYQSSRYWYGTSTSTSPSPDLYSLPLPTAAVYAVTMYFAELIAADGRLFNVSLEGVEVKPPFNIKALVGFKTAYSFHTTVSVTDGWLNISMAPLSAVPFINGIEVWFNGSAPTSAPTQSPTAQPTLNPTAAPTTLAPTAAPTTASPTPSPTVLSSLTLVHRISFGRFAGFVDDLNVTWSGDGCDVPFDASTCTARALGLNTTGASTTAPIINSGIYAPLYNTSRIWYSETPSILVSPTLYSLAVPSASMYAVRIYFSEVTEQTGRTFNIELEGVEVKPAFDVTALVGFRTVYSFFTVVSVSDGRLDISLTPLTQIPFMNGIEVWVNGTMPPTVAPTTAPTAQPTSAPTTAPTTSPTTASPVSAPTAAPALDSVDDTGSSSAPLGAIIGGTVGGAVLVGGGVWWYLKKRGIIQYSGLE